MWDLEWPPCHMSKYTDLTKAQRANEGCLRKESSALIQQGTRNHRGKGVAILLTEYFFPTYMSQHLFLFALIQKKVR